MEKTYCYCQDKRTGRHLPPSKAPVEEIGITKSGKHTVLECPICQQKFYKRRSTKKCLPRNSYAKGAAIIRSMF